MSNRSADDRKARLAAALRENLRRRKAAARNAQETVPEGRVTGAAAQEPDRL
jgi:hypothetical protein